MLPVNTTSTSLGYQPGLDGLRGVFVVAVLLFHGGFSWAIGGYLGVSAFFTLSGFLICSLLVDERARSGRIDLVHFWRRRARRLLPAAWLALAMAFVYGVTLGSPTVQRSIQGDILAALGYVANWRFIVTDSSYEALFSEPSPVTHLWSLAIEEQYYLVFPLLVVGVLALAGGRRWVLGATFVVLALASTVWMMVLHEPGMDTARVYYGTDTRVAEMLIGAAAALGWRRWMMNPGAAHHHRVIDPALQIAAGVGLAVLVGSWTQIEVTSSSLYRGGFALHALIVVLVVVAATRPGPIRSITSFEPLRRLGLISYGVYLYHWPIFLWLNAARTGLDGWGLFALRCAVTLAVSVASYLAVERPIRSGVRLRGRTPLVVAPMSAVALVAAVLVFQPPPPTLMQTVAVGTEIDPFADLDLGDDGRVIDAAPAAEAVPRISVFGDSTAIGPFEGLLDVDSTTGGLVVVPGRMVLGCGLVRTPAMRTLGEVYPLSDTCASWPEFWSSILSKSSPDIALVLFGPWDVSDRMLEGGSDWVAVGDPGYDEHARAEIRRALELLTERVDLVVWLTSPPIDQGRGQMTGTADPASDPARIERWNELIRSEVDQYDDDVATVVDLNAWFHQLPNGPFDPQLRPDGVHIATSEAPIVGRWLAGELQSIWTSRGGRSG